MKLVATLAAVLLTSTPSGRAAEEKPGNLKEVRTLEELKALEPVDAGDGWTVRVGLGDAGKEAGPWKLLYCLATHAGKEPTASIAHEGDSHGKLLGPVCFRVSDGETLFKSLSRTAFTASGPSEAIYCASIPVAWEGRYVITVFSLKGKRLLEGAFAIDEVHPCTWHDFAELRRSEGSSYACVRKETRAVVPESDGLAPVWSNDRTEKLLGHRDGTPLPGTVPVAAPWRTRVTGEATILRLREGESLPPVLKLSIAGRVLVVDSPVNMLTWPDERLLARWWVNGKPVVAALTDKVLMQEKARLVSYGKRMKVSFGLPETLGALGVGDMVSLQVLYAPGGLRQLTKTRVDLELLKALRTGKEDAASVPLLSNRIDIKLSPELLAAAADPAPPGDEDLAPTDPEPESGPRVTLSKETTRITEPLREDGYPDYVAAVNALTSAGVTRKNNAAVLLWRALGPKEIERPLRKKYFRALGMKVPRKNGEYFKPFSDFEDEVMPEPEDDADDPLLLEEQLDEAISRPWSRDEFPLLVQWLDANEKPLELVVRASRREHYYSPQVGEGEPPLVSCLIVGIQGMRDAIKCLTARALLRAKEGQWEEACEDLLAGHRLGRFVGRTPILIHTLIGHALAGMATQGSSALTMEEGLPAAVAQKFLKQLEQLPPAPSALKCLDTGERYFFLDAVCMLARNPGAITTMDEGPSSGGFLDTIRDAVVRSAFDWDEILRIGNHWMDRMVDAGRLEDRKERNKALGAIMEELEKQATQQSKPLVRAAAMLSKEGRSKHVGMILVSLMLPVTGSVFKTENESLQRFDLARLALALAAHRAEHGEYPETLEKLKGTSLGEIPADRFSDEPLKYSRRDKGYLLYSVGPNGKDDGGETEEEDDLAIIR